MAIGAVCFRHRCRADVGSGFRSVAAVVTVVVTLLQVMAGGPAAADGGVATATTGKPVTIGIDAEFGLHNSTSAQAIERGARVAIAEINQRGGVLGGRPLVLELRDNRSVPARAIDNLAELAAVPDLVAVLCGRFSPIVLETLSQIHESGLILLDPWASADGITDHSFAPNRVFRLSLRDSWAMPVMMRHALRKGANAVGVLVVNTGWGRSSLVALERHVARSGTPAIAAVEWYNWGDRTFLERYGRLKLAGAGAVILIANDLEASAFARELAQLPPDERLPVISHWGVTGGRMVEASGTALFDIDFSVVQTFSFFEPAGDAPANRDSGPIRQRHSERIEAFLAGYAALYGPTEAAAIASPVGVAHTYDLVHLLARAVDAAGSTDRNAVREALENIRGYRGLVRDFPEPFTALRHDALSEQDVFMAHYTRDGVLIPVAPESEDGSRSKGETQTVR